MILSKKELIETLESCYDITTQVEALNKAISDKLSDFAEANNLSKKIMRSAYSTFKTFRSGNVTMKDDEYTAVMSIIEEHFAVEDSTEDTVSA